MKVWFNWIILILLIVGVSAKAYSDPFNSWTSPDSKQSVIEILSSRYLLSSLELLVDGDDGNMRSKISHLDNRSSSSDSGVQLTTSSASEGFSSDNLPLIPTCTSAMLFRDNLQTKPIYWLKAEFNPPDLTIPTFSNFSFKQNDSPWFMQSKQKSSSRLSGWKDGNSLYTASITYH